jgi:hypothetical protein
VKAILLGARERARSILEERRHDLDVLAEVLLEKESLDRRDLDSHFSPTKPVELREAGPAEAATSELLDGPRHPLP